MITGVAIFFLVTSAGGFMSLLRHIDDCVHRRVAYSQNHVAWHLAISLLFLWCAEVLGKMAATT